MPFRIPAKYYYLETAEREPSAQALLEYIAWITQELALAELKLKQIEGTTADGVPE